MNVKPETIANELQDELHDLYVKSMRFVSPKDQRFVKISDKAEVLGKASGAQRSIVLARLYAIAGNIEESEYHIRNAEKNHAPANDVLLTKITSYMVLGFFQKAAELVKECRDPSRNLMPLFLRSPPNVGVFHLMRDFELKTVELNMPNIPKLGSFNDAAIRVMDAWGDTDDDYVAVLDIAGTIMRQRGLLPTERGLLVGVRSSANDDKHSYVKLSYEVEVDFDESLDMTSEFTERLARSNIKIPPSLVFDFTPTEIHEHATV